VANNIEKMWAERAARFIEDQPKGIDTWRHGATVEVTTLRQTYDPHLEITDVVDADGQVTHRQADFWMRGVHLATFVYGPPRRWRKRARLNTIYP
jgi:hypothetical protein